MAFFMVVAVYENRLAAALGAARQLTRRPEGGG
jgi:hypothetical protein